MFYFSDIIPQIISYRKSSLWLAVKAFHLPLDRMLPHSPPDATISAYAIESRDNSLLQTNAKKPLTFLLNVL